MYKSLFEAVVCYVGIALEDELGDEDREDLYHADEPVDDDIDRDGLDDFIVRDTGENEMGRSRGHSMYSGQSDRAVQVSVLYVAATLILVVWHEYIYWHGYKFHILYCIDLMPIIPTA